MTTFRQVICTRKWFANTAAVSLLSLLGGLALTLESAAVGEKVWIIPGSWMPIMLRALGRGKYKLIRERYVHEVMHGEGFEGMNLVQLAIHRPRIVWIAPITSMQNSFNQIWLSNYSQKFMEMSTSKLPKFSHAPDRNQEPLMWKVSCSPPAACMIELDYVPGNLWDWHYMVCILL